MKIDPREQEILGRWSVQAGHPHADARCHRIEKLVTHHLRELARDPTGWDILYVDPDDGRFWEHTYPESEMHGGGPSMLRHVSEAAVRAKYGEVAAKAAGRR